MPHLNLDLRGLKCPLPVLRTRKALRALAVGERVVVACTDPMAVIDIPHMVHEDGHALEAQDTAAGITRFTIRKLAIRNSRDANAAPWPSGHGHRPDKI